MAADGLAKAGLWTAMAGAAFTFSVRSNFLNPMFLAFDVPVPFSTMGRRNVSNVPAQALTLLNDPLGPQARLAWAERLLAERPATTRADGQAIPDRLGRKPTEEGDPSLLRLSRSARADRGRAIATIASLERPLPRADQHERIHLHRLIFSAERSMHCRPIYAIAD